MLQLNNQDTPPNTEKIVVIRKIFKKSSFFEITIGTTITSGGIGKNELSIKEIVAKIIFGTFMSC